MSSIWTPDGEHGVGRDLKTGGEPPAGNRTPAGFQQPAGAVEPTPAEMQAQMDELRRQLAETPAALVVSNHCFGLFELGALHLSTRPPQLGEAQLAIDALSALVESLTGRLGDAEPQLREGLNQLRMAFIQIRQGANDSPN